ncbi:MAG: hypothetical protein IJU37_09240 [Desulfovibrio sp.]|nr:hypothetical protein [Desulfovibrio sp.]
MAINPLLVSAGNGAFAVHKEKGFFPVFYGCTKRFVCLSPAAAGHDSWHVTVHADLAQKFSEAFATFGSQDVGVTPALHKELYHRVPPSTILIGYDDGIIAADTLWIPYAKAMDTLSR